MNFHQRSEDLAPTISGKKINNNFTCTVKEVRKLSPQFYEQLGRQKTYQTDSFKQILTKRSGCPSNKENISTLNKVLKKIKQERISHLNSQENKKMSKSNDKRVQKKSSTVSLTKIFKRNQSAKQIRKKQAKSVSPSRDIKDYRSGPVQKKNYLSNNASQKNRQVIPSRSEKSLTDRIKNPIKINSNLLKKQLKNQKKQQKKVKKTKNTSKISINNKKQNYSKTQALAKQFDYMLKAQKSKVKKTKKKKSPQQKAKKSKSKEKKVIISHNNSKTYLSRNKLNSHFSDQSVQSPQKAILSTRYENQKQSQRVQKGQKKKRLSFEPSRKKGKSGQKAKTQALSPEKNLSNKNEAATTIQRVFRGYLTRKYISQFKRIILAVITIQKWWRGCMARKKFQQMKKQSQKGRKKQLKIDRFQNFIQFPKRDDSPQIQNQLASLLQQILNQQHVNQKIKHKINDFLKKEQKIHSSRSNSIKSHLQQQMKSQKRFFQQNDKKKNKFGSPLMKLSPNPRLQRSDIQKSPEVMIQNLLTIKQFQRQKLITNAKLQIEGLESLALKNIFSPRTRDIKKNQIHQKLTEDLNKFDESITQVIKSCKENEDAVGPIKPFQGHSTPQKISPLSRHDFKQYPQHSPQMHECLDILQKSSQKLNSSSQHKLQDLSMQLLQYYEQKTHSKHQRQYEKLDSSYQFIEQYLLSLFQYLRQMGYEYRQNFINIMRTSRNLQIVSFLRNLNVLTQDSDQDISFKLPMYKFLQQQEVEVLSPDIAEQFNNSNTKLQRHQLGMKVSVQDVYLKMIIDTVNEALNLERPNQYMFTQTSLLGKGNRMRILQLQALDGLDGEDNEPQFSFYFANSMNHIYKWAHLQCGRTVNQSYNEQSVMEMNESSIKQYLKYEALKEQNYYDELLQVIVALANCIFDQIILEEGVGLYF